MPGLSQLAKTQNWRLLRILFLWQRRLSSYSAAWQTFGLLRLTSRSGSSPRLRKSTVAPPVSD